MNFSPLTSPLGEKEAFDSHLTFILLASHCLNVESASTVVHSPADGHSGCSQIFICYKSATLGLPGWLSGEDSACRFRRRECDPWLGKIPEALEQLGRLATSFEPVLWSLGTATRELRSHSDWGSRAREPRLHNQRDHMRRLCPRLQRGPAPTAREGPLHDQRSPCSSQAPPQPDKSEQENNRGSSTPSAPALVSVWIRPGDSLSCRGWDSHTHIRNFTKPRPFVAQSSSSILLSQSKKAPQFPLTV